ncbi:MAG: type II toxin-antitoxin system RelE/ParE family toxin, partial [Chloroflexi bacterium]|nr:type II toxin-antitoxin system RelE/ParE family toxin [Chloroflexota bacterium]
LQQYMHYVGQDVPAIAERFLRAVNQSMNAIVAMPGAGAPRRARNPQLLGLRTWPVRGFEEFRIYYVTHGDLVEIVRVLHGRRNIRAILERPEMDNSGAQ